MSREFMVAKTFRLRRGKKRQRKLEKKKKRRKRER